MDKVDGALDSVDKFFIYRDWRIVGENTISTLAAEVRRLRAEVRRLRAERDELRAAAKRLSEERRSGLASLDAWVQLRAALSRTEGGEVGG